MTKSAAPASVITNATENLKNACRVIVVAGAPATGKTTFSMSASRFAGDTLPLYGQRRARILCKDVLVIQGDNEGIMGAMDAGLEPAYVLDMTDMQDWVAYQKKLVQGLRELQQQLTDGTIRVVILDLQHPARLIDKYIDPSVQKDWKLVANEGMALYRALSGLRGVTVIGNTQIKAAVTMVGEHQITADAAAAKSIGGERSTFTIDLPKGIGTIWRNNTSMMLTREAKRVKDNAGKLTRKYTTLTQSSHKHEAKSRAESTLPPTIEGHHTLHAILKRAYGEGY